MTYRRPNTSKSGPALSQSRHCFLSTSPRPGYSARGILCRSGAGIGLWHANKVRRPESVLPGARRRTPNMFSACQPRPPACILRCARHTDHSMREIDSDHRRNPQSRLAALAPRTLQRPFASRNPPFPIVGLTGLCCSELESCRARFRSGYFTTSVPGMVSCIGIPELARETCADAVNSVR